MMNRHAVIAGAVSLLAAAGCGGPSQTNTDTDPAVAMESANVEPTTTEATTTGAAPAATGQATPATPPAEPAKFVPPVRGLAEIALTKPAVKRVGNEIVTTISVKNMSATNSIVGLKVDEFWYDKAGEPVTGDTFRHPKPLQPGEIVEVTLRTPVNPNMDRNQYQFAHANGDVKTTIVPKL
jgi:hypothetical protein